MMRTAETLPHFRHPYEVPGPGAEIEQLMVSSAEITPMSIVRCFHSLLFVTTLALAELGGELVDVVQKTYRFVLGNRK